MQRRIMDLEREKEKEDGDRRNFKMREGRRVYIGVWSVDEIVVVEIKKQSEGNGSEVFNRI